MKKTTCFVSKSCPKMQACPKFLDSSAFVDFGFFVSIRVQKSTGRVQTCPKDACPNVSKSVQNCVQNAPPPSSEMFMLLLPKQHHLDLSRAYPDDPRRVQTCPNVSKIFWILKRRVQTCPKVSKRVQTGPTNRACLKWRA